MPLWRGGRVGMTVATKRTFTNEHAPQEAALRRRREYLPRLSEIAARRYRTVRLSAGRGDVPALTRTRPRDDDGETTLEPSAEDRYDRTNKEEVENGSTRRNRVWNADDLSLHTEPRRLFAIRKSRIWHAGV